MYILGKSGSGKSCLIQLLVKNDIDNGYGCAVLDPHGDLVDDILKMVPKHRAKDVVLFDPSDVEYPPSFNPLSAIRPELKMRATIGFIEVFRRILGSDWTEKMDHIIRYSMLALLQIPGSSMLSMRKLLTDPDYREAVLDKVEDEQVRRFWMEEFLHREKEFEGDISRILNRLDHLLATDMVRNIVGQPMNLFNFREFMDSRKIVLIKVSKGILGAENAQLLGSLIIAKIYEAAMSRADMPSESRQDFYFYIDEFQNFSTESFGEILSESRKYRLSLTFANQYLGQLPAGIRQTVFGNVGNIVGFRVGGGDAAVLADEFKPRFSAEDIMNLGARDFYVKMSIDGEVQEAFSGRTLELHTPLESEHFAKECVRLSRSKYSLPLDHAKEALNFSEYGVYEREARAETDSATEPEGTFAEEAEQFESEAEQSPEA
ncbi:MAG: type IV secretory system conjugative DNA transfer family protein [Proteobacteria bacterium]|nr:type IV secretory system conjugative DNA transfer family protein [Pseudomonadota bacterium]